MWYDGVLFPKFLDTSGCYIYTICQPPNDQCHEYHRFNVETMYYDTIILEEGQFKTLGWGEANKWCPIKNNCNYYYYYTTNEARRLKNFTICNLI